MKNTLSPRSKINFALVIHNHQPVDNDDEVIEKVYARSYSPFLKYLSMFPQVKANLHYSGYLLEWLEKRHSEFVSLLQKMVKRGQIEVIGGGYYEPILTAIPERDALGQIGLLSQKIKALFGAKPNGLWMAERAWEPSAPEPLARAGIKFTILDDTIFQLSGVSEEECFFPYLVESRGSSVVIFPLLKKLRYFIPFQPVSRTISFLKKRNENYQDNQECIAVYGDDGEKFGAWPTTYEEVYTRGWLRSFFENLTLNQNWLKTVLLSDYLSSSTKNVQRRIHLPSASYAELMEWSVPVTPKHHSTSNASGFWRLFLSKYAESGELYSRMLAVSKMIDRLHGDSDVKQRALIELWKAQYNDVYWHGIFGGLYFSKFRRVAYHHLIKAQSLIESSLHRRNQDWISIHNNFTSSKNFDDLITINSALLGLVVKPSLGGSITEVDFKPIAVNLTDVLARRYESYHRDIIELEQRKRRTRKRAKGVTSIHELLSVKERGLEELLVYDRYPKASFLDYMLEKNTTIDDFQKQEFTELARFAGNPYHLDTDTRRNEISLILSRKSTLMYDKDATVSLKKTIKINPKESKFTVNYDIDLGEERRKGGLSDARFASEINLGSLGDRTFEKNFGRLSKLSNARSVKFRYPEVGVSLELSFDNGVSVWLVPVKSVSKSESGFESNLQGISIIPNFVLNESSRFGVSFSMYES
jgi:predicted glycosyl hydrolase (DUF1957 family)